MVEREVYVRSIPADNTPWTCKQRVKHWPHNKLSFLVDSQKQWQHKSHTILTKIQIKKKKNLFQTCSSHIRPAHNLSSCLMMNKMNTCKTVEKQLLDAHPVILVRINTCQTRNGSSFIGWTQTSMPFHWRWTLVRIVYDVIWYRLNIPMLAKYQLRTNTCQSHTLFHLV